MSESTPPKYIKHIPCPNCGSSDARALYEDGGEHCFSCGVTEGAPRQWTKKAIQEQQEYEIKVLKLKYPIAEHYSELSDRNISETTASKYLVQFQPDKKVQHVYPYFDKDGRHVANKLRLQGPGKAFLSEGLFSETILFGQQLFPPGSAKAITVTEGECDALAVSEMFGNKYPAVSVRNAATAVNDCARQLPYLDSFETIVICFDKDEAHVRPDGSHYYPGQEAALKVAQLFRPGKVKILTLRDGKDANEYLYSHSATKFIDEWYKAPTYTPSGLKYGKDLWEEISKEDNYESVPYPWATTNNFAYGIRLSEVVLFTGETGDGKTSIVKEIEHHLLRNTKYGIGLLHLEETNRETGLGLMSITADKPLHLPDVRAGVSKDELKEYYDKTLNNDHIVVYDHFGSNSITEILTKIRHMVALGCKYIIIDHLSIIVSDQSGDERKQLDEISTKLKTLCVELNIAVIAVIHLNRQGLIRSSAGPEQLANIIFQIYRNKDEIDPWRRNVTKIVCKKNRFSGRTGPCTWLWYNAATGRLQELDFKSVKAYEDGGIGEEPI